VAIGRAIVREPQVFLFDEPLSNLDAKLRGHMRAELALLHERLGKTTLYVTHDQVEAMTLASRIVILDKGRIQQVGTPAEVFNRPANLFVAGFIGTPTMNLFAARCAEEGGRTRLRGHGFELPAPAWLRGAASQPAPQVTAGIRPQALRPVLGAADAAGAALTVRVDVVEYLGTESQIVGHLVTPNNEPGQRVTATVPGDAKALLHKNVSLVVGAEDMHLFDPADGRALRP
jgi:ABC-type sugar transport system ATPase subunit